EPDMVAEVVTLKVLHQPGPVLDLPEQHRLVKLVDQGIGGVFAKVSAVGTVGQNSQAGVSTIHHEQATTCGNLHRTLGVTTDRHHQSHIVPGLLSDSVKVCPDE